MEWDDEFHWKQDSYYGSVLSLQQVRDLIEDFEYTTCTSFSEIRSTKKFGQFCVEVNVKECCPACGMKPEEGEELMRCGMCDLRFHRKPHCVGDDIARSDLDVIICKRCNNNVE